MDDDGCLFETEKKSEVVWCLVTDEVGREKQKQERGVGDRGAVVGGRRVYIRERGSRLDQYNQYYGQLSPIYLSYLLAPAAHLHTERRHSTHL